MNGATTDKGAIEPTANFEDIHRCERARLNLTPEDVSELAGIGLALSGGGIRSASFALGVVQVLLNEGALSKVDYLSTVSGGGYLGSAISWWLHQAATATATDDSFKSSAHSVDRYEAFRLQFGSKVTGARTYTKARMQAAADQKQLPLWEPSNWLAYIRQHGNYLQPRGVGIASLAASVLRICLYPLFIYGSALVGLFSLVKAFEDWYGDPDLLEHIGLLGAILPLLILVLISWLYGPATWFTSRLGEGMSRCLYRGRTYFRDYSAKLLSMIGTGLLIASIPWLCLCVLPSRIAQISAMLSSLSLGSVGTIYQFFKGRAQSKSPSWVGRLRLILTSGLLIYGLLLASFTIAHASPYPFSTGLAALGFSVIFGLFVNTNLSGLSRLYRDRLMEAFMPDPAGVATNTWGLAVGANVQEVSKLEGRLERCGKLEQANGTACQRPLHLLNCNVVLIDSKNDRFRNRGGDSFIISQLWSGCDATGWIRTQYLGDGAMTLSTAMSISGAAANPSSGPNGLGVTRNRFVSFMMSLFNVRLGFWLSNPRIIRAKLSNNPNFWFPGFFQGLLGLGLNETASFVELTDGGHFDNTAIYELVRRRTKLIIVTQAGCDPDCTMEDLANAIEKIRVDFSVFIEFEDKEFSLDALRAPDTKPFTPCERGYALGRIRYPVGTPTSPQFDDGCIVYLQAVPTRLPADIASYWRRHSKFPNDTTADQFFTEENLEAYRELGYAIMSQFYRELKIYDQHNPPQQQISPPCLLSAIANGLLR